MEAVATEISNCTEGTAFICGDNALGGILYHQQIVPMGDIHDGIHLARNASVVNGHDHARAI